MSPQLPRIEPGQTKMTTASPNRRLDPSAESQPGRDVANMGKAVAQMGFKMQEVQNLQQRTKASSNTTAKRNKILSDQNNDPDFSDERKAYYNSELKKAAPGEAQGIVHSGTRALFLANQEGATAAASLKIENSMRTKMLVDLKIRTDEVIHQEMVNAALATNQAEKDTARLNVTDLLEMLNVTGAIKPEEYMKQKLNLKDKFRAVQTQLTTNGILSVAETDAVGANKMLEASNLTAEEKRQVTGEIASAAKIGQEKFELEKVKIQADNQSEVLKAVKDKEMSYVQKKQKIQELSEDDGLSKGTLDTAILLLNSTDAISAKTYNNEFADAVRMIDSLNVGLTKDDDSKTAKEYLLQVQNVKNAITDIHSAGRLTEDDMEILITKVDKDTTANQRKATKAVRAEGGIIWDYTYGDASKDFETNLKNKAFIDAAMRDYFYAIEDKDFNKQEKKAEMRSIVKTYTDRLLSGNVVNVLSVGTEENGYRFKGGDRYNKNNWEKISG